jgi:hypothetical protein
LAENQLPSPIIKVALLVLLLSASSVSFTQQALTEPEFSDVFFRLDNGKLTSLEHETAVMKAIVGGFMVVMARKVVEASKARE